MAAVNEWGPREQRMLERWKDVCLQRRRIYYLSSLFYYRVIVWTSNPTAVLAALLGTLTLSTFSLEIGDPATRAILIFTGVLQCVIAVGEGIKGVYDFPSRFAAHKDAFSRVSALLTSIDEQLLSAPEERVPAHHFLSDIQATFDDVLLSDVTVPWRWLKNEHLIQPEDRDRVLFVQDLNGASSVTIGARRPTHAHRRHRGASHAPVHDDEADMPESPVTPRPNADAGKAGPAEDAAFAGVVVVPS